MCMLGAYSHAGIHSLSIWADLLVLQSRLDQVNGEDTGNANNSCHTAIDDARHQPNKYTINTAKQSVVIFVTNTNITILLNMI